MWRYKVTEKSELYVKLDKMEVEVLQVNEVINIQ